MKSIPSSFPFRQGLLGCVLMLGAALNLQAGTYEDMKAFSDFNAVCVRQITELENRIILTSYAARQTNQGAMLARPKLKPMPEPPADLEQREYPDAELEKEIKAIQDNLDLLILRRRDLRDAKARLDQAQARRAQEGPKK